MPIASKAQRLTLTRRYQTALAAVVANATPTMHRLWDGLPAYDEANVETLAVAAAPPLQAVKQASVRHSLGYYTVLAGVKPPTIKPAEVAATADMRDPFISTWLALKSGNSFEAALLAGRARVVAVVANLVNSTARQTGDLFVAKANLETAGWERITNRGACAWCESVAGQLYQSADSADFGHDRCACTAAPLFIS